jgi:NAD-dependent DNA ligase
MAKQTSFYPTRLLLAAPNTSISEIAFHRKYFQSQSYIFHHSDYSLMHHNMQQRQQDRFVYTGSSNIQNARDKYFSGDSHGFTQAIKYLPEESIFSALCLSGSKEQYDYIDPRYVPQESPQSLKVARATLEKFSKEYAEGKSTISQDQLRLLEYKINVLAQQIKEVGQDEQNVSADLTLCTGNSYKAYTLHNVEQYFKHIHSTGGVDINTLQFSITPKFSGLKLHLIYRNGTIAQASAYDTQDQELDVTELVCSIAKVGRTKIPKSIPDLSEISVTGDLTIDTANFNSLNLARVKSGQQEWQDPQAAIIDSILHEEDANFALGARLSCYFTDWSYGERHKYEESNAHLMLHQYGFSRMPSSYSTKGQWNQLPDVALSARALPFQCSAFVIQPIVSDDYSPRQSCTYMPLPKYHISTITKLKGLGLEGTSGLIMQAVHTGSEMFTFNNPNEYNSLSIKEGSEALIRTPIYKNTKPKFVVACNDNEGISKFPTKCPTCSTPGVHKKTVESVGLYCPTHDAACRSVIAKEIEDCYGKHGLYVPLLSKDVINLLVQELLVSQPCDVLYLTQERIEGTLVKNLDCVPQLLEQISRAKNTTLGRFMFFMLPSLSAKVAEGLAHKAGTLESIKMMQQNELIKYGLDKSAAKHLRSIISTEEGTSFVDSILAAGVRIVEPDARVQKLLSIPAKQYSYTQRKKLQQLISDCNENPTKYPDHIYDALENKMKVVTGHVVDALLPGSRVPDVVRTRLDDPCALYTKSNSIDEAKDQCKKFLKEREEDIVIEPKINGFACTLQYIDGHLKAAYTKSSMSKGSLDITKLIMQCKKIPHSLKGSTFSGSIRGELYVSKSDLQNIDTDSKVKSVFAVLYSLINSPQPQKFVVGIVNFFGYEIEYSDMDAKTQDSQNSILTRVELYNWLTAVGFTSKIGAQCVVFKKPLMAMRYLANREAVERQCDSDVDGLVIKLNTLHIEKEGHYYKFPPIEAVTTIHSVRAVATKGGKVLITAKIQPIELGDQQISTVTIQDHHLLQKRLYEGNSVVVTYIRGACILQNVIKTYDDSTKNLIQLKCGHCNKTISWQDATSDHLSHKCKNHDQEVINSHTIKFCSKMDISEPAIIKKLIKGGIIAVWSDLFSIDLTVASNANIGVSTAEIEKLRQDIELAKIMPSYKWLQALNIYNVGPATIRKIAENQALGICTLLRMSEEEMQTSGLAEEQSRILRIWIDNNQEEVQSLLESFGGVEAPTAQSYNLLEVIHGQIHEINAMNSSALQSGVQTLSANLQKLENAKRQLSYINNPNAAKMHSMLQSSIEHTSSLIDILKMEAKRYDEQDAQWHNMHSEFQGDDYINLMGIGSVE